MKKVLIIGPYITNIGGVSIHISRLMHLLKGDFEFDFMDESRQRSEGVYNIRSLNPFPYIKKMISADIVHIHSGISILRLFHIIVCLLLFKKTIVTVHRDINIEKRKKLTRFFLRRCSKIILVNQVSYDFVTENYKKSNCFLIPAFLPPILENEPELPSEVKKWIGNCRSQHGFLLSANASYLAINNGQDLYGLDMCIDAVQKLNNKSNAQIFLIFVVVDTLKNVSLLQKYKKEIVARNLQNHILIWEGGLSFIRLIQQSDVVLRTTNTDGDALTIRESLFFNKPVIASDVVSRPEGTIVFKTRNLDSLVEAIAKTLRGNTQGKSKITVPNYKQIYTDIYNS
ncbi:MAG: glycosyltransferase [Bacteroidales bacterium]|nr:glycosyltransferase [Bacteroidales bacterium]